MCGPKGPPEPAPPAVPRCSYKATENLSHPGPIDFYYLFLTINFQMHQELNYLFLNIEFLMPMQLSGILIPVVLGQIEWPHGCFSF